ncbi:hypothetical protein LWI28_024231 [Acer negundo]|uniref:Uncharacterized protein n=1 Tax=Acer negundo TaxID=4023 RepID=A0AAD5JUW7_ACENE|nr:hypothetical protein LWI28_024231 [Acer negundo]
MERNHGLVGIQIDICNRDELTHQFDLSVMIITISYYGIMYFLFKRLLKWQQLDLAKDAFTSLMKQEMEPKKKASPQRNVLASAYRL